MVMVLLTKKEKSADEDGVKEKVNYWSLSRHFYCFIFNLNLISNIPLYNRIKREKNEKKGKGWTVKRLRRDESDANGGEKNAQFQNLDHIEIPTAGLEN